MITRRFVTLSLLLLAGAAETASAQSTPQQRWEYFYQQRAYPFDRIPAGALHAAREQLRRPDLLRIPPPVAGNQWTSIGPEGIPINIASIGRLSTIAVHPSNSSIIYIGGAQGGVWKTTDAGANWTPMTDRECSLAMGSIAIDPVDTDVIYAGTGEQHFSGDSYYGCGILRSVDAGNAWTQLGASTFQTASGGAKIAKVVIDPTTAGTPATTTIYVASDFGLYRSDDGGATLTELLTGIATDFALHPVATDTLYAARRGIGVAKSDDRGATWTELTNGWPTASVGRINMTLSPSNPSILYASVHNASNSQLLGIWKTIDGGASWTQATATNASCGSQCWYDMVIAVHPTNPDTVYFGGVQLYRSTDGGGSFSNVTGAIHVDQHAFVFDPQNPDVVYAGNDGGIFRSDVGGASWVSLNTNLALTQFYPGISLHPFDPSVVLGGTQDNGTLQYDGAIDWSHVLGGDGGFTAIDHQNPTVRYAETQWTAGTSFGGPRRSDGGSFIRKVSGINVSESGLFIPPLVMDPSDPTVLYFGLEMVYRTSDRAETWTSISPNLGRVTAIAPAVSDQGVVYVGTNVGRVEVTTDTGSAWTSTSLPANRFVTDVAVDPFDWQTAYAVVSGFNSGHVFRTTNAAGTWTDVSSNLPDIPVNAVLVDPATRATVFLGTDLGVFASSDSGGTWAAITTGMPNVAVFDLAYNANTGTLIAATHGRGMFSLDINRSLTLAVTPRTRNVETEVGATQPEADSTNVLLTGTGAGAANWSATHGAAPWLTLQVPSGTGSGILRWARDPTGLAIGTYVDTITITVPGAIDSPAQVIDTLQIIGFAALPAAREDTILSGSVDLVADSALVVGTADTTTWSVSHTGVTWLTLNQTAGQGTTYVRWTVNPASLLPGTYNDTLTVMTSAADTAQVIVSLTMEEPAIVAACAFDLLARNQCLGDVEQRYLDLTGNNDGTYNLGDFVGYLQRTASPPKPQENR